MSSVDAVLSNATLTADGSFVFRAGESAEASLVYNIAGPVTGSVTFTVAEVDPADELTVVGQSKTTAAITAAGTGIITISLFNSTTVRVSWDVSVGGSIGATTASIFRKNYPGLAAVTFGASGGAATLDRSVSLSYDQNDLAIVANLWKRVITYSVPALYTATILKYTSYQNDAAFSRVVVTEIMGTHNNATNTFTGGFAYSAIQFAPFVYANVTTAIAAGAGNVTYTVTYTNQSGVSGRTGTITVPRGSLVETRVGMVLQAGDYGVRSIQNVSGTPTVVGAIELVGTIPLAIHADRDSTAQTETVFSPGVLTVKTGGVIGIEYAGSATSKQRVFDVLFQLVQ